MNWDEVQGKWHQMKGSVQHQFGKLTQDDVEQIAGQREKLVGKLQERYGYTREDAVKRADEWLRMAPQGQTQGQHAQQGQRSQQPPPPQQQRGDAQSHQKR
jgi:uncharacterized protein YjbJ (UPF0337 family)